MWPALPISLLIAVTGAIPTVDFTMSLNPPPTPGSEFKITWAPSFASQKVTLSLNYYDVFNTTGLKVSAEPLLYKKDVIASKTYTSTNL